MYLIVFCPSLDYETGAIEGVEDPAEETTEAPEEEDPDVPEPPTLPAPSPGGLKRGRGRPPKNPTMGPSTANQVQNFLANLGLPGNINIYFTRQTV